MERWKELGQHNSPGLHNSITPNPWSMSIKDRIGRLILGKKEGKTLVEKVLDGPQQQPPRPEDGIYNPLHLVIRDIVELRFEEAGSYEVYQIVENNTQIDEAFYPSTRYFLRDGSAVEEFEPLVIELMKPRNNRPSIPYLFHIVEEFGYDKDFLKLLDDDIFIISEETDEEEIEKEYEKSCHIGSSTITIDETRRIKHGAVNVWNYELEDELETLYLIVEIDRQDGWTTIYEGRRLLEGEWEIYQLSTQGGK